MIHKRFPSKEIKAALIIFIELVAITAIDNKGTINSFIILLYCPGITSNISNNSVPLISSAPANTTVKAIPKAAFNITIGLEVKCFNSRLNNAIF